MLDEADELAAELLGRMLLMVLLRGPSPCNVDEEKGRTGARCSVPAVTLKLGRRPRPLCPALAAMLLVLMLSMVVLMLPRVPAAWGADEET